MYWAIYPSKDNVITNVSINGSSKTGSNAGLSEVLEIFALTSSFVNTGISRILMKFDTTQLSNSIVSGDILTSSVEYRLRLKNSFHHEKNASSFIVEVRPLSRSWDEGNGLALYDEERKDSGYSNWTNATSLVSWTTTGSDFIPGVSITQSFDSGYEDIDLNIGTIVDSWLSGTYANHGITIKLIDAHETGSTDVFNKKFYSRHAHVPERRPRLEVLWTEVKQDDRNNMKYNLTGSLIFYNYKKGRLQNFSNPVYVNILNSSSTVIQTITASNIETGIYLASGAIVSFTSSTQIFRDVWFSGTNQYFTGTFIPQYDTGSFEYYYEPLDIALATLQSTYKTNEKVTIKVQARKKDYTPAIRITASTDLEALFLQEAWYSILNDETEEVIVNFSTGSNKYSKLSYDKNGNYFNFWTSGLTENNVYRIKILVNYNDQEIVFDEGWTFKIEE